jgi:Ca2+/Na+ antiporter
MLAFVGLFVSYFFYCLVALFGWLSFEYGHKNNKAEVLSIVRYTWARSKLSERLRDFKLW